MLRSDPSQVFLLKSWPLIFFVGRRRLFKWRELPYAEIVSCDVSRAGVGIGYIRLKYFLWPWGKLYFTLDAHMGRGSLPLLDFIQERIGK
jgi:hypothetical protein